jgi:hypothetical protein
MAEEGRVGAQELEAGAREVEAEVEMVVGEVGRVGHCREVQRQLQVCLKVARDALHLPAQQQSNSYEHAQLYRFAWMSAYEHSHYLQGRWLGEQLCC